MLTPYLACQASAGSGKTWQLSLRYVALLFMGVQSERILCLTFTKKAAKEMSERIGALLETLPQRQSELETLCLWLESTPADLLARLPDLREKFLRAHTRITTIDAFLHQILRSFSLHLGLSPLIEVGLLPKSDLQAQFLATLQNRGELKHLIGLCLEQHKSVESILEELGTLYNSESTLAAFAPQMVEAGAIEAAKKQVRAKAAELAKLVTDHPDASSTAKNQFADTDPKTLAQKSWLDRESLNYRTFGKCFSPQMDTLFGELKSALSRWFTLREGAALWRLARLESAYEEAAFACNQRARKLGFDDVTHLVYALLSQNRSAIDASFFYFRLDGQIEHLLIDEFQDTSTVQFEILRPIIEEFTAGVGTQAQAALKSFFYVGDIKQSIYRFRGGNPHLFGAVRDRYTNIAMQNLAVNFRSRPELVRFVNDRFGPLMADFTPQNASREAGGFVQVRESEEPLEALRHQVGALLQAQIPPEEIAVLVFSNKDGQAAAESLTTHFPALRVVTETTRLLINQPAVAALIEGCKWLYFDDALALANFNHLRGADPFEATCPLAFKPLLGGVPLELCHRLIGHFGLGNDGDLLRFLEWVGTLQNIEALLYGYAHLTDTASSSIGEGLTILTIHKSKGLEFDHLIVLDRLSRPSADTARLMLHHEGVTLKSIHYKLSGREKVDPHYAEIVDAQKAESDRDALNVLYVALTRARESLSIVAKPKSSAFEPLTLSPLTVGSFPSAATPPQKVAQSQPIPVTPRPLG